MLMISFAVGEKTVIIYEDAATKYLLQLPGPIPEMASEMEISFFATDDTVLVPPEAVCM